MFSITTRRALLASAAVLSLTLAGQASAQAQKPAAALAYDLERQDLGKALTAVAQASGREVIVPSDLVAGKGAPALKGRFTPDQAFERLLANSGLILVPVGDKLVLRRALSTAQGEPQAGDPEVLSELVVTGTRIRGAAPAGAHVITIGREDIEASGYATTQEILQAVPQNFGGGPNDATSGMSIRNGAGKNIGLGSSINLRGLGANSTLVLVNGVRPPLGGISGTFADLSLIPSTALERIEVLPDGASALYGSDAVGGVVNLIFRDRFDGAEAKVRYGSADGDFSEVQASAIVGKAWSRVRASLAYEYFRRGSLAAADRDYATSDLRAFGGPDMRFNYAAPGTIVAGGRNFAIPSGQNGVGLTPSRLKADQINRSDGWANADLLPRQTTHSVYGSGAIDLSATLSLYAQGMFAQREFSRRTIPDQRVVTVPVTNPFYVDPIGTRQPVRVQYDFSSDLGAEFTNGRTRAANVMAGADQKLGDWSVNLQGGAGRQSELARANNRVSTYRLNLALADTNPASAYNVFGDARSTPTATINAIRGASETLGRYDVRFATLKGDGPIFSLPGGADRQLHGADYRWERYHLETRSNLSAAPSVTPVAYPKPREIVAAYGELAVPLVGPENGRLGLRGLDLSIATRFEHYSDFGDTTNPKVGLTWRPVGSLKLLATYGTSFRAPTFEDQLQGPDYVLYQPVTLSDPAAAGGSSNAIALLGNVPDLGPERATTWTLGAELQPVALPGLRLSVGYFNTAYKDRVASINGDIFNTLLNRTLYGGVITASPSASAVDGYYASPYFYNPSALDAGSIRYIIDARVKNISRVEQDGIDFDATYRGGLGGSVYEAGLSGTYILSMTRGVTAGAPMASILDTVGNPSALRLRGRLSWRRGPVEVGAFVNFVDGYTNQTVNPAEHVRSWTTMDLQVGYRFDAASGPLKQLRVSLAASNLFDQDPPYAVLRTPTSAVGFDADKASPVGRLISVTVTKGW